MGDLLELLQDLKDDVDFENIDNLVDGKYLDSLDIIQIINALNDEYDITIPASEIIPENFNSTEAIFAMVERLMED